MAKTPKKATREASKGKVLLAAPKKVSSASAGGVEYQVDRDGFVEVAPHHAAALIDHGFTEPEFDEDEADDAPPTDPATPPTDAPPTK